MKSNFLDFFLSQGKIYVVVATIVIILLGIFIYLILIDKRLRKIEKRDLDNNDNMFYDS